MFIPDVRNISQGVTHRGGGLFLFAAAVLSLLLAPRPSFAADPQRIISLAPATTEILFSLGLDSRIVGVTSFCDRPEAAKGKPKVGGMSNPSLETVVALKPDLVVMSTDGNPREAEARLRSLGLTTYVWTERTLAELPTGIRRLGAAVGLQLRAEQLARDIESSLASSRLKVNSVRKIKALYIVWPEPLLVAGPGTAIHDAMTLLGFANTAGQAQTAYPRYSIEEVIREEPELLFIGRGSGMDMRTVSQGILKKLTTVPAVRNGKVCYVGDGLYRLAPRVIEGMEELAACAR